MAAKNFYDAVLIGLDLRTLLTAALLAKRGLRVLVIGHGQPWPSYQVHGVTLPRSTFSLTGYESPAIARVFSEIALRPLLSRRLKPLSPAFQALLPGHRFDVLRDARLLTRELEREFPEARRFADELLAALGETGRRIDHVLERDLMWPPEGFFERREFARATLHEPFAESLASGSRHALADDHPFSRVLEETLRFADGSSLEGGYSARKLRLLSGRTRAAELVDDALTGLFELLIQSIRTHNGSLRLTERLDGLTVRRGALTSLHVSPSDEEIGCHFLLWGLPVSRLASLLQDRTQLDPMFVEVGEPRARYARYCLNLVVRAEALPEGMARDVLLLADQPLWIEQKRLAHGERALLTIETLLPNEPADERARRLLDQRERMLDALGELSPFLRSHLLLVDSPHDGRPIDDVESGSKVEPAEPFHRGPDTMRNVYTFPRTRLHGTAGLTVRTPLKGILLCNDQVVTGLGVEGAFLTAWSAARAVSRSLRRGWMNRGRWTKVEL
jgi:hypothetical protein